MSEKPHSANLAFLDTLRGVAILAVFLLHAVGCFFERNQLPWKGSFKDYSVLGDFYWLVALPFTFGWAGVALFFVISGFCIHLSFARQPSDFRPFFVRRFFRIYPPYLFFLLFIVIFRDHLWPTDLFNTLQIGSHLLMLHNLHWRFFFAIDPPFWSIAIEFQLYMIYPALYLLKQRWGWPTALLMAGLVELLFRLAGQLIPFPLNHENYRFFAELPFAYWFSWSIGAWLAERHLRQLSIPGCIPFLWIGGIGIIASDFWLPLNGFRFPLAAVFFAGCICWLLSKKHGLKQPSAIVRHLRFVGTISYSVYLLHLPLLEAWRFLLNRYTPTSSSIHFIGMLCSWPLCLFLSYWSWKWLEKPSIALGKGIVAKMPKKTCVL